MSRFRRLPPSYWAMLGSVLTAGVLWVANMLLGWEQAWIQLLLLLLVLGAAVYNFRMLWKQADADASDEGSSATARDGSSNAG